jgi:dipeptidyl aminopeptidase/acylaminoacyl peptidase
VLLIAASVALLAAALGVPSSALARGFALSDLERLVSLSTPQISPDGRRVVLVVGKPDFEHDRTVKNLDLVDVASGERRTLTVGRKSPSSPAWSPQGDRIAFLADVDDKSQIYVMPMNGGDAIRVTDSPTGVEQFAWRPDGGAIAYVAIDDAPKRTGADKYRDAFAIANNDYLARGPAYPGHLYVVPASGGKAKRLTRGAWSVLVGESSSTISWSHDGKTIAFARAANAILDTEDFSTVWLADAASGAVRQLTSHTAHERDPHFSPDGLRVAYAYAEGDTQINLIELYVTGSSGGNGTNLTRPIDRPVADVAWSPDGSALYMTTADGALDVVYEVPLAGKPRRLDLGALAIASPLEGAIAESGGLAFVASTATQPPELYYADAHGGSPRKLTDYNAPIAKLDLSRAEALQFDGPNGFRENAIVNYPANYTAGRKYPLVVLIHGGPTSASTLNFRYDVQLLAARGWFVLRPNYRGSNNLGLAYQRAILHDVAAGPGRDIIAAVNALRAKGEIDDRRIGVSGWSYGGIMTSWMITHYHIWRAALSGAGVHDWIADYALADDMAEDRVLFHGSPFVGGNAAEWRAASPLTYARQITTPLLILSDVGDARVPIPESYELFRALTDLGKPVEFYAYPINGHYPEDPVRAADIERRWGEWFARHF